jgi:hypothetical protein
VEYRRKEKKNSTPPKKTKTNMTANIGGWDERNESITGTVKIK